MALKKLKDESKLENFLKEARILKSANFIHIVKFFGIYLNEKSYYLVLEYVSGGNLRDFIIDHSPELYVSHLLKMILDTCSGMIFLANKHIVHGDLRLSNLLVTKIDEKYVVKISDFGLSRSILFSNITDLSDDVAIKWAAPETLKYQNFSEKSDVWAFGIVMWEIFSKGKLPYTDLSNSQTINQVIEQGYRLPQPKDCPPLIYDLMIACWNFNSEDRPSFSSFLNPIQNLWKEKLQEESSTKIQSQIVFNSTQEGSINRSSFYEP